jgi:hypothetical protein
MSEVTFKERLNSESFTIFATTIAIRKLYITICIECD